MKKIFGVLFLIATATAGCVTETTGSDDGTIVTCSPTEGTCASDPRMPEVRAALDSVGVDLDRDVEVVTLGASCEAEALAIVDEATPSDSVPGATARSFCSGVTPFHGTCCWESQEGCGCFSCVQW